MTLIVITSMLLVMVTVPSSAVSIDDSTSKPDRFNSHKLTATLRHVLLLHEHQQHSSRSTAPNSTPLHPDIVRTYVAMALCLHGYA